MVVAGLTPRGSPGWCGEMLRAAVGEVVAVHRGDDDVVQAELGHRVGDLLRLVRVERLGQAGARRCRRRRPACRCRP